MNIQNIHYVLLIIIVSVTAYYCFKYIFTTCCTCVVVFQSSVPSYVDLFLNVIQTPEYYYYY